MWGEVGDPVAVSLSDTGWAYLDGPAQLSFTKVRGELKDTNATNPKERTSAIAATPVITTP